MTHRGATRQPGTSTVDRSLVQAVSVVRVCRQCMNEEARFHNMTYQCIVFGQA